MNNPKRIGNLTELQCLLYLFKLGYDISQPYGDNSRYDFILDVDNNLYKIQCKTSHPLEKGVYEFKCNSSRCNTKGTYKTYYTKEDVDFFATFINERCYLIPFKETSTHSKILRFVSTKNNQTKGITFGFEYEAEKQIEKLKKEESV